MLRVFSFGGGVQSTAALVLASQGRIDFRTFLFSNVGDDSERPATLEYVRSVAMPFAVASGLDLRELQRVCRDGSVETLYGRLVKEGSRSLSIPVRMSGTGAPNKRSCTVDFKVRVVAKWLRQNGATSDDPAIVGLGISVDEFQRMRTDSGIPYEVLSYPLVDMRLSRQDCVNIISSAGLSIPPKSACWFCPFHRLSVWQAMRLDEPELFARAVGLERLLNERCVAIGHKAVYLSSSLVPLDVATSDVRQLSMFDVDDACESGYCLT